MNPRVDKPVTFTLHAQERMRRRGTNEREVTSAIREGAWSPANRVKLRTSKTFQFGRPSPLTGKVYSYKTVDVIFASEPQDIVVITVKVYYHNE